VQPTDHEFGRFLCSFGSAEAAEEDRAWIPSRRRRAGSPHENADPADRGGDGCNRHDGDGRWGVAAGVL